MTQKVTFLKDGIISTVNRTVDLTSFTEKILCDRLGTTGTVDVLNKIETSDYFLHHRLQRKGRGPKWVILIKVKGCTLFSSPHPFVPLFSIYPRPECSQPLT